MAAGIARRIGRAVAVLSLAGTVSASPVLARDLTIGLAGAITSVDPHFFNAGPNINLAMHIFDALTRRDPKGAVQPGLAESWQAVSDTEWVFRLRPGVTWHDGRPFTAEDVAFTFARVPNVPNSPATFASYLRAISKVEVVDPLTLKLTTASPYPLLPTDLATISIVAKHVVDGAGTEDFNSGRAAIGTGPYRLVVFRPGSGVELSANPGWWNGAQPWDKVNLRLMTNAAARTAAVIAGDADVIEQVPTADLAKLRDDPRVRIAETPSWRMMFLAADRSRDDSPVFVADNNGKPLAHNPFNDLRVRQALSLAISRDALVQRVMEGSGTPTLQWLPPGAFGHNPEVQVPQQDLAAARRLLAEAGYPDGFQLTLHATNDRYPNDARLAQALAQMFTRAGIRTTVEALPFSTFAARASRQEFGLYMIAWGSQTGEASNMLANIFGTYNRQAGFGSGNFTRYSNPDLDALTARAVATVDNAAREPLLRQAVKMASDDLGVIPLFQMNNVWALRPGLAMEPRSDERTLATSIRPEAPSSR